MYLKPLQAQNVAHCDSMRSLVSIAWDILRMFSTLGMPRVFQGTQQGGHFCKVRASADNTG